MNSGLPYISVIIPTRDRPIALRRCMDALRRQTYPAAGFEVIVVDDGSARPLDEEIRGSGVPMNTVLVRQDNAGPAAARNRGAAIAGGELLAFTDDDCVPEPGWLSALADGYRRFPGALLGGWVRTRRDAGLYALVSQIILDGAYAFYNKSPDHAVFFASNNIAASADIFNVLGGFAEQFRVASEDRELCDRWRWTGHRLLYLPEAVVYHERKLGFRGFMRQHFNYGRGAFLYHRERARRRSGSFLAELGAQGRFIATFAPRVRRQPLSTALKTCGLIALWQGVNAAGFLYAAARHTGWLRARNRGG